MKVTSKINIKGLNQINDIAIQSLVETADALTTNLRESKTMPFDTGNLQNRDGGVTKSGIKVDGTRVDSSKKFQGRVTIYSGAPYARRLYFHPEFNFQQGKNPNAGAEWFEPYINGNKKTFASKAFARIMRSKMK